VTGHFFQSLAWRVIIGLGSGQTPSIKVASSVGNSQGEKFRTLVWGQVIPLAQ
jgi:hypothetical protein